MRHVLNLEFWVLPHNIGGRLSITQELQDKVYRKAESSNHGLPTADARINLNLIEHHGASLADSDRTVQANQSNRWCGEQILPILTPLLYGFCTKERSGRRQACIEPAT
jgi:hypothetical protein